MNVISKLNKVDYQLLKLLYERRCFSFEQAWKHSYINILTYEEFVNKRIKPLIKFRLLDLRTSNTGVNVVFLTNKGIEIVQKHFHLPNEVWNKEKEIVKVTAGELSIQGKLLNHQIELNEFVYNFELLANKLKYSFEYFDEKWTSKFSNIRPDGLITINGVNLFIEQDMSTENSTQLKEKWNRYRLYLNRCNEKIIVLFIVKCYPDYLEKRKDLIRHTARTIFNQMLGENFDIYVGSLEEIILALENKVLPVIYENYKIPLYLEKLFKLHSYTLTKGDKLKISTGGVAVGYYARKLINGRINISKGRIQEFLLDDYFYQPMSIYSKMTFAERISYVFDISYNREIDYLIIVPDEEVIYSHLAQMNFNFNTRVKFTTIKRLQMLPLYKAVFVFSPNGDMYSFKDEGYEELIYIKKIAKK